ncbi:hypothetical protein KEJ34_02985 [Candidatus Bathyarchaeota archaeon]|nr:hypothetical protein [Candidatus Bathyarchaeota archaeon]
MLSEARRCFSKCNRFKCGKNFLIFRGKTPWCRWTDEPCNPSNCNYAICVNRRLLPGGICGETLKRKTVDRNLEDEMIPSIKVRGKTFRKIGEKELI